MAIRTHEGIRSFWRAKVLDYGYDVEIKRSVGDDVGGCGSVFLVHEQYGSTEIPYDLAPSGADLRRLERMATQILQTRDPASWASDTLGG